MGVDPQRLAEIKAAAEQLTGWLPDSFGSTGIDLVDTPEPAPEQVAEVQPDHDIVTDAIPDAAPADGIDPEIAERAKAHHDSLETWIQNKSVMHGFDESNLNLRLRVNTGGDDGVGTDGKKKRRAADKMLREAAIQQLLDDLAQAQRDMAAASEAMMAIASEYLTPEELERPPGLSDAEWNEILKQRMESAYEDGRVPEEKMRDFLDQYDKFQAANAQAQRVVNRLQEQHRLHVVYIDELNQQLARTRDQINDIDRILLLQNPDEQKAALDLFLRDNPDIDTPSTDLDGDGTPSAEEVKQVLEQKEADDTLEKDTVVAEAAGIQTQLDSIGGDQYVSEQDFTGNELDSLLADGLFSDTSEEASSSFRTSAAPVITATATNESYNYVLPETVQPTDDFQVAAADQEGKEPDTDVEPETQVSIIKNNNNFGMA